MTHILYALLMVVPWALPALVCVLRWGQSPPGAVGRDVAVVAALNGVVTIPMAWYFMTVEPPFIVPLWTAAVSTGAALLLGGALMLADRLAGQRPAPYQAPPDKEQTP